MIVPLELGYGRLPFTTAAEFLASDQPDFAISTVSFKLQRLGDHRTQFVTETRVHWLSCDAVKRFSPYWYLIRPVSKLIRQRIPSSIQRNVSMAAS